MSWSCADWDRNTGTVAVGMTLAEQRKEVKERFGRPMAEGRTCGRCSVCCTVWGVPEIGKGKREVCRYNTRGGHCGIYAERPERCRGYECLWRLGWEDHADRPDKTGWLVDLYRDGGEEMIRVAQVDRERSAPSWVQQLMDRAEASGRTVEVHLAHRKEAWRIQPRQNAIGTCGA